MLRYLPLTALCFAVVPAMAAELPIRKPGLWEVKIGFENRSSVQTLQQCTDASTDAMMHSAGGTSKEICSKRDLQTSGGTMTLDSLCTINGKSVATRAVINGSFDSAYTMTVTTRSAGPPQPGDMPPLTMVMEAKWLGDCKADQKPGDVIMPGGIKLNVREMEGLLPGPDIPRRRF